MGNQSGKPEKIVAFRQPNRGEITNFQNPNLGQLKPVAINSTTLIETLFTNDSLNTETGMPSYSKAEMLDMALHRAKKAA